MPTPTEQLLSRTVYATDGTTVNWDFSFASGYLDAAHVKAQTKTAEGTITQIVVTPGMLIGQFQLQITPALAAGLELTIYRDTPKSAPLVDFMDESGFSETALDTNAKQAVMVAAEAIDTINSTDLGAAVEAADAAQIAATAANAAATAAAASVASIGTAVTDAQDASADAIAAAASVNPANFATAAQGVKADSAIQPAGFTIAAINGATALGRSLMAVADAAALRAYAGITSFGSSIATAVDAAAGRTVLGLGSLATKSAVSSADIDAAAVTAAKLSGQQSGSAPVYGVRAWCVFNGTLTGTNAPIAGGNVTSVTRNSVGDYTVTLAVALPSTNFAVLPSANASATKADACEGVAARTTTSVQVLVSAGGGSAAMADSALVSVLIVG